MVVGGRARPRTFGLDPSTLLQTGLPAPVIGTAASLIQ